MPTPPRRRDLDATALATTTSSTCRPVSRSLAGLRVVLDCANGAMSAGRARRRSRALGADVIVIHDTPDGRNINDQLRRDARRRRWPRRWCRTAPHLGLAFDGDGDRVIAVDHLGNVVDGDRLIALAALQLRDEGELVDDTVVVTVMSNLGFHQAMAAAGIHVVTTAVGDRYVLEALDAGGFSVGGEQSGHIIYRDLATTGDGLLAGLRLAAVRAGARGRPLAELAAEVMTSYPQVLVNVRVADRHPRRGRRAGRRDRRRRGGAGRRRPRPACAPAAPSRSSG